MAHVKQTVLVVDDHASFRVHARTLLEAEGYQVVGEAGDARSAIAIAAALRPDIALIDVNLPDDDGFAVVTALRMARTANALVLVSTLHRDDFGDQLERSGANGFITKSDLSAATLAVAVGSSVPA